MKGYKKNPYRWYVAWVVFFVAILTVTIATIHSLATPLVIDRPNYTHETKFDYQQSVDYWRYIIKRDGGESAFAQMVTDGTQYLNPDQQHTLAHSFGQALYETSGLTGITACQQTFFSGCHHQFIGAAIIDNGSVIVPDILNACQNSSQVFFCEHGIGHGLLGYLGYRQKDLLIGTNICNTVSTSKVNSCLSGLFMEYHLRELALENSSNQFEPRPLTPENKYAHCMLPEMDFYTKASCVLELPTWWQAALKVPSTFTEKIGIIGKYCKNVSEPFVNVCFAGAGLTIARNGAHTLEAVAELCRILAPHNNTHFTMCVSSVARFQRLVYDHTTNTWCNTLLSSHTNQRYCEAYVSNATRDEVFLVSRGDTLTVPE